MMETPIIYLCIHRWLEKKFRTYEFTRNELKIFLGRSHQVPKNLRDPVIKEMELFNLIKSVGSNKLIVLKNNIKLKNTSKIYKDVGLF